MRDVLRLHDVLSDIAECGGAGASAARRLLQWASAQPTAAAAAVGDGDFDDAADAVDADDADDDAHHRALKLRLTLVGKP